jgi:A/G-specific adenine glycosylase
MKNKVARKLLDWYAQKGRSLPWRDVRDPYAIWVAEIMLQQTQVDTVIPYYRRWMVRFPTVTALADADQQQVLKLWEGLGYYGRARNLHRAAQVVVEKFNGQIPRKRAELESIPGIGAYTAGAIASMAYGQDEIALDGNLRRVLARIFNIEVLVGSPQADRRFAEVWRENLPGGQAGDYNQALMDLGATVCTPRAPDCVHCPMSKVCIARQLDLQDLRPVTKKRASIPHYIVTAAVIHRNGRVLITRRPANGLLGGLWEFPGGKQEPGEDLHACLKREIEEELAVPILVGEKVGVFRHAYTHFKVTLHAFECQLHSGEPRAVQADEVCWVMPKQLEEFPMGKIDRQIAAQISAVKP